MPPMPINRTTLNPTEYAALAQHEATVASSITTFAAVGAALRAIRDERLFRASHPSFEGYCLDRWALRPNAVSRLIAAAQVMEHLAGLNAPTPTSEAHVRPLTQFADPEQQRRAWIAAVANAPHGKPTSKHVQAAVAEIVTIQREIAAPLPVKPKSLVGRRPPTPERLNVTTIKVGAHTVLVHGPEAPALAALITELLTNVERPSNGNGNGH